ncbi:MAG: aminodeoxychorismate synthase component I [Anaerolineae bacterium]|nr:aminodeoxychorismate synthase component I [Anaerolineae bacterium]
MDKIKPYNHLSDPYNIFLKEEENWLHFTNPQQLISVDKTEDIIAALNEIEGLVNKNNWYAAGFLSYEAASAFDSALQIHTDTDFPLLWFGLYEKPQIISLESPTSQFEELNWELSVDRKTYKLALKKIKAYIANAQTYQVNYTLRLLAEFKGDPWNFFRYLTQFQNQNAGYIDTGRYVICSASPELFFQLEGETLTCRPMKGTRERGRTTAEDRKQAQLLKESEKNQAENVMIVDMIRNDIGRIAKVGSVQVPDLFSTEQYFTLWQMTSTITAKTNSPISDIFSALFPPASITGAPKVSTMRIIKELETTPRRIYTGSIGYIGPNRKAKFNVAIRTALIDLENQIVEYGVGGGIVWDSIIKEEYAEAILKARVVTEQTPKFSLFETMYWSPEKGYFLRNKHVARLLDSAHYFNFDISKQDLEKLLDHISLKFKTPQRIKLLLDKFGRLTSEIKSYQYKENQPVLNIYLAKDFVNSSNIFLFHKTTHRVVYTNAQDAIEKDIKIGTNEIFDVLLYNENEELTEFTVGNLVVEISGKLYTPPVNCGLLPGTFRALLLETNKVLEKVIKIKDLENCTKIYRINSIHKWREGKLV